MAAVPDGKGGVVHKMVPVSAAPARKVKRKARPAPDPIHANPEAAAQALKLFIERIMRLQDEIAEMQADVSDVFLEAKSQGYDKKGMQAIIALLKKEKNLRDEEEAILDTYKTALGLN
ncbi:GapR family DNA-binding domain-containing protein [Sphingomonas sp. PR090111-T3T-6A]|uniref:DUF2312 domain-containing protein n=1 Tax=Sphingomonas sp. PR090111-T3T-6A TaxID=685778 RepID=UPI00035F09F3